jgi:hypothetical protein
MQDSNKVTSFSQAISGICNGDLVAWKNNKKV